MAETPVIGQDSILPTGWRMVKLGQVLQRVRKPVDVEPHTTYQEIGIRSHGKGIFYKEPITGAALGEKAVFWVQPGCFIVNIVFAWEQAVARTTASEVGMIASHRFPMYSPKEGELDLDYVVRFFKTPQGKYLLGLASPGGAGRNKTLGQEAFLDLSIPLPPYPEQRKIATILGTWDEAIALTERRIAVGQQRKLGLMQRLLTGRVRFPEFSGHSEMPRQLDQETPPGWRSLRFGDIVSLGSSKFDPQADPTPLPCLELEHISQRTGVILGSVPANVQKSIKNRFTSGQVLFGKLRPYLRKYALPEFDGVCSSEIWVFSPNQDVCDSRYLFYFVQCEEFIGAASISSGTKMPRADWSLVSEAVFTLPSMAEQRRIAEVLAACDHELDLLARKRDALQRQKRGLMQQLLTGRVQVKV